MRAIAIGTLLLLLVPAAGALLVPVAPGVPPLPADIRDGDVLLMLAQQRGLQVERLPVPLASPGMPLSFAVTLVAARAGTTVPPADLAAFDALHPSVQQPVATMLLAIDQAWALRDQAFEGVPLEAQVAAFAAMQRGDLDQANLVIGPGGQALLIDAAILLADTIEGVVLPQLEAAADLGIWPATPVADPVGVLRIGGTGNDFETLDRILQIDARGNDVYFNNAGGTTIIHDDEPSTLDIAAAVSIDLRGADAYENIDQSQGGGVFGIGVLYDVAGDDSYDGGFQFSIGAGAAGVGLLRDRAGEDAYRVASLGLGFGSLGLGYTRDDASSDSWQTGTLSGGVGDQGVGLLWDRSAVDSHISLTQRVWGYAEDGGDGWYADEGNGIDGYLADGAPHTRACNNCRWSWPAEGHGNDNDGGLAVLLSEQRGLP